MQKRYRDIEQDRPTDKTTDTSVKHLFGLKLPIFLNNNFFMPQN